MASSGQISTGITSALRVQRREGNKLRVGALGNTSTEGWIVNERRIWTRESGVTMWKHE